MQHQQPGQQPAANSDPIFDQLCQTQGLAGAFSMTLDATVLLACGDFLNDSAQLHAPVIHNILLDTKGVLDTNPFSTGRRTPELLKRIVLSYKSFNLAIIRVQDTIYVAKVFNLDEEGQDIHPEDIAQA